MKKVFTFSIKVYKKYLLKVEKTWENKHPVSFALYALCKSGLAQSISDLNVFIQLRARFTTGESLSSFKRNELIIFRRFPPLIMKSLPVIILASLPGASIMLPLLFLRPTTLLTPYFWTENQKSSFYQKSLVDRNLYLDKVHKDFLSHLCKVDKKHKIDSKTSEVLKSFQNLDIISSVDEVHLLIPLFQEHFCLQKLPFSYVRHLRWSHDIPKNFTTASREKLKRHSTLIGNEDLHLVTENLTKVPQSEIEELCITRGLNPYKLPKDEAIQFLGCWARGSSRADIDQHSYRLHLLLFVTRCYQLYFQQRSLYK